MPNSKEISATAQSDQTFHLHTVDEAIADIAAGKVVIVVDSEDRENEGDFICAGELVTPEIINFMATYGRGLICTPISAAQAKAMDLTLMVKNNTALHETAFTVSIDYNGPGCTTGISAHDRARGIQALTNPHTRSEDYARPGHIFPLIAVDGGVLRRPGHTEAAIDLATLAGCQPVGVVVEILNPDGSMARLPQLIELSNKLDIKIISISDLVAYRLNHETLVDQISSHPLVGDLEDFRLTVFHDQTTAMNHLAITYGTWTEDDAVLTRVFSAPDQDLVMGLLTGTYGPRYSRIIQAIRSAGAGVFILIRKDVEESSFVQIVDRFISGELQNESHASIPSHMHRDIGIGAQIIRKLGIRRLNILTNSQRTPVGLEGYGIEVNAMVNF